MTAVRQSLYPPPAEPLSTLYVERGHVCYCAWRNVSIAVWVGQATLPVVQGVHEVTKSMIARFPYGHSSINFVLDGVPAPTSEGQALLTKLFDTRSQLMVTGIVLEGSGFWASGLRGMINNSHREAGGSASLKIMTHIDPLVGWFVEEHEGRTRARMLPMQLRETLVHARQVGEALARGEE